MNPTVFIHDNEEFMLALESLLNEIKEINRTGSFKILSEEEISLPDDPEKMHRFDVDSDDGCFDFALVFEDQKTSMTETMRQMGVILYHLATGESELTEERYLLDGYKPINIESWVILSYLLRKAVNSTEELENLINALAKKPVNEVKAIEVKNPSNPVIEIVPLRKESIPKVLLSNLDLDHLKIIGHDDVSRIWNAPVPDDLQIRYTEETLQQAIEENKNGEQWVLGFYSGLNLRQMREKIGTDSSKPPFFRGNNWWLKEKEDFWATLNNVEPGYYLVNFKGKFGDTIYKEQNRALREMYGSYCDRCHELIVSELSLSNFQIRNQEHLMENYFHSGITSESSSKPITVSFDSQNGLYVGVCLENIGLSNNKVVIFKKFDF